MKYIDFLVNSSPNMYWGSHLTRHISGVIDEMIMGKIKNVVIFMDYRSGKSELVSKHLPAYWLDRRGDDRIFVCSYSYSLSASFADFSRSIYKKTHHSDGWLADESIVPISPASSINGICDLVIIDDPVISEREASSETYNDISWRWYTEVLCKKKRSIDTPTIIVSSRWDTDRDMVSRILANALPGEWLEIDAQIRSITR